VAATQPQAASQGLRKYSSGGFEYFTNAFAATWRFSRRKPLGGIGLFLLLFIATFTIVGWNWTPQDPLEIHARALFHHPQWMHGWRHLWRHNFMLGTDHLGRDQLSRLMNGAHRSIYVSFVSVTSGAIIGYMLGLYSGYYQDWRDVVISRIIDTLMSIPALVLAIAIVSVQGPTFRPLGSSVSSFLHIPSQSSVIIAIAVIQIPGTARVVRSVVISIRNIEYVQAARAVGAGDWRIILRHVAPQTAAPVIILITSAFGTAIIIEASLSFLGLGTPPPNASWGQMLSGPTLQNVERAPWNVVFPGIILTLTVFGFNLIGDALRDYLDPRLRA